MNLPMTSSEVLPRRRSRLIAFGLVAAALVGEFGHIVYTWSLLSATLPVDAEHYTRFDSVWTFFLPSSIGLALGMVAAWLSCTARSRYWPWFVSLTALLALCYVYYVNRAMYYSYNPNHSGPFL